MAGPVRQVDGFNIRVQELDDVKASLEYLRDLTGADIKWLAQNQMRLWCNDLIKRTAADPSAGFREQQNQSKDAITNDLHQVFNIIEDYQNPPFTNSSGQPVLRHRNGKYFVRFPAGGFWLVDRLPRSEMEAFHTSRRGGDGEVRRASNRGPQAWVSQRDFNGYKRHVFKQIGKLKAGWLFGAQHFADQTGLDVDSARYIDQAQSQPGCAGSGSSDGMDENGNGMLKAENQVEYAPFRVGNSLLQSTSRRRQDDMNTDAQARIEQIIDQFNDGQDVLSQLNRSQFA